MRIHALSGLAASLVVAGPLLVCACDDTPAAVVDLSVLPDLGGPYGCAGQAWAAAPGATVQARFQSFFRWRGNDYDHRTHYEGLKVAACAADGDCASPLASGTTDASGAVTLALPTPGPGFQGYIRLTDTNALTQRQFFWPPIATASSRYLATDWEMAAFTTQEFSDLLVSLGRPAWDAAKGAVIASAIDCQGIKTGAVDITLGGKGPDVGATDEDKLWSPLAPGTYEVLGKVHATGQVVGRFQAQVVAGALTGLNFGPMPTL